MGAIDLAASVGALAIGEFLAVKFADRLTIGVVRHLQKTVRPGVIDSSFPNWLRVRAEASIASITGIPSLFLTLVALQGVKGINRVVDGPGGIALAIVGTIALLAYGATRFSSKLTTAKILWLSLPTFGLVVMNLVGLIVLLATSPD